MSKREKSENVTNHNKSTPDELKQLSMKSPGKGYLPGSFGNCTPNDFACNAQRTSMPKNNSQIDYDPDWIYRNLH